MSIDLDLFRWTPPKFSEFPSSVGVIITKGCRDGLSEIGKARNSAKEPNWTRRMSKAFTDAQINELGMYGEYAASSYLGLKVDQKIHRVGDSGHDLVFGRMKIAVKYNHRWRGYMIVEGRIGDDLKIGHIRDFNSDAIILTHGICAPPVCKCFKDDAAIFVVVAGWLTKEKFLKRMSSVNWGLGLRYYCRCDQLDPIHTVFGLERA